jgi:hypothetical protein
MGPEILVHILASAAHIHGKNTDLEHRKVELSALKMQIDHDYDRMDHQAALARNLISSLIDRRIDAVQSGFREVLSMYKDQADHFMAQQSNLEDAKIMVTSPLQSANYDARITDIDIQLSKIRSDARLLYDEMNRMLMLIGGSMPNLGNDFQRTLMLN